MSNEYDTEMIFDMRDTKWEIWDTSIVLSRDIILGNGFAISAHPYGDGHIATHVTDGVRSVAYLKNPREAEAFAAACLAFNTHDQIVSEVLDRGKAAQATYRKRS